MGFLAGMAGAMSADERNTAASTTGFLGTSPKSQNARAGFRSDGKLELHPSRVENNIVVFGHALGEGAAHGIRIGSSSGNADQQCLAWNPFTNPFGDDPDQTGNPWVPVKYNCVWNSTGQGIPFAGAIWYVSGYVDPQTGTRRYGEKNENPIPDVVFKPTVQSIAVIGKGNPYRIDVAQIEDNLYGMQRTIGAFEVKDTALPLVDHYSVCLNCPE